MRRARGSFRARDGVRDAISSTLDADDGIGFVNHDDDTLMQRTAAGDEMAFQVLVARWEQPVVAFLTHMLGSPDDARDLAQDTFLKVYDHADRYRAGGKFRSWLLRIAGNKARSALRRRKVLRWVTFDPERHERAAGGDDPAQSLEREERVTRVRRAIAALPERQRQAVVLQRFQGLSYQEIADVLETTVPAVESLLQRAAAALRRDLARDLDPAGREEAI
jgi:RNA polymerase sigma-70 factor (ECF subfamily)